MKPGYKQTEVGVIPEEWDVAELSAVTTQIGDGLHGTPLYSTNGSYFFINGNNLGDGRIVFTNDTQSVGRAEFIKHRKPLGDRSILMSINGTIGNLALFNDEPVMLGKSVAFLNVSPRVSKNFIYHSLRAPKVKQQFFGGLTGSTIGNLGLATIRGTKIPLPPSEDEQRAIAEALSDVDGLLGGLDRLIAKKRDLKQAAMQQLLTGQTRLPGFHGEWEVKRLGDVASVSKGTQLHSSETDDGGKFAHLNGGITPSSYTHKSNTDGNTIAISEGGNSCGFVQFMTEPYWCGGHCYSVIPNSVDNHFLYHALKGQQSAIMGLRVGSGLPNVQKTGLLDFKVALPATLPEQTAIAEVLTEVDGELAVLEQRREKTRSLKQAMMQELLTGRTRLV